MRTKTLAAAATAVLLAGFAYAADMPAPVQADVQRLSDEAALHAARGSWSAAIADYRRALASAPRDAALHNRLGICYQRAGDLKSARREHRAALELRKDYAEAWNNLGTVEHASGKYKAAISAYSKALKLKQDPVVYRNVGTAWLARGDVQKALEAWGEAYRLDPASFDGPSDGVPAGGVTPMRQYHLLAKLVAARGNVDEAIAFLTKARAHGFSDFGAVERDPDFAAVVKDARYAAIKQ
jgi:tetratricopeptide (TPR) repeat protein